MAFVVLQRFPAVRSVDDTASLPLKGYGRLMIEEAVALDETRRDTCRSYTLLLQHDGSRQPSKGSQGMISETLTRLIVVRVECF